MLNIRTEFSFREAFGPVEKVAQRCADLGYRAACISDHSNTYGHQPWIAACNKAGIKPVLAATFNVVADAANRSKIAGMGQVSVIAMNHDGLSTLYKLVATATNPDTNFYYVPRLGFKDIAALEDDGNVITVGWGGIEWDAVPVDAALVAPGLDVRYPKRIMRIAGMNNLYPSTDMSQVYELTTENLPATYPAHLMDRDEWLSICEDEAAWYWAETICDQADVTIDRAPMVTYPGKKPGALETMCREGANPRGINLDDPEYAARLTRELTLIEDKGYVDYFLVVADLIAYAKRHMLVGPARGSSAGSLVCYLCGITEVDPLQHGLLFERFIDINRADLPDIDIDFPDSRREQVIAYLRDKYGSENVSHIGTVSRLGARSAIKDFARGLGIAQYEVKAVVDSIIERSSGDARAAMCIEDTFTTTGPGQDFIKKHPNMKLVYHAEDHARHSGIHAAGIIVSNNPITDYAGFDTRRDCAMLDKHEAEDLNLLKIDILGLRTLSIIQDCIDDVGIEPDFLYRLPLDDEKAFDVFNQMNLCGIFQFEGPALKMLTRQMGVGSFDDIAAISALARPGPLHNGGATEFIARRNGDVKVTYYSDHPSVVKHTEAELGTFIYQEQIMSIGRDFGRLSWEDVSALRKAMSKSLGEEFFNKYQRNFMAGAKEAGIEAEEADVVWQAMMTFGSYGFNKAHAVGYGLLSYWCAYLKAHHPLAFARANLNHARSLESTLQLLREFGYEYTAVDPLRSTDRWEVRNGKLVGPLTAVKGIGPKMCAEIIKRRDHDEELTERQTNLLAGGTPYDDLYPARTLWGHLYDSPIDNGIATKPTLIEDIQDAGEYVIIGKLVDRNPRDLNEYASVSRRNGRRITGQTKFLNMTLEDDTGQIFCSIGRFEYEAMGKEIAENGQVGEDWYLVRGSINDTWRRINVKKIRKLNAEDYKKSESCTETAA